MKTFLLSFLLIVSSLAQSQTENKEIDSLKTLLSKSQNEREAPNLIVELSNSYLYINADSTRYYLEMAKPLLSRSPDSTKSDWYMTSYAMHLDAKRFDSAKYHLDKTKQYKDLNYHYSRRYYDNLGFYYYYKANFSKALSAWSEAYDLSVKEQDLEFQRNFLGKIAVCHQQLGNFQEGIEIQLLALDLAKKTDNKDSEARAYNNMGMLFEKLEDYDKALENLLKGIKIDSLLGNEQSKVNSYINLGIVHRKIGEKKQDTTFLLKAKKYYQTALEISRELEYSQGIYGSVSNMAILESTMGNDEQAIVFGREAIQLNVEAADKVGELTARSNLALSLKYTGNIQEAESQANRAIALGKETGFRSGLLDAYFVLSSVKKEQGDYKEAYNAYVNYSEIEDSISSGEVKNRVNELEIRYQTAEREVDLAQTRASLAESEIEVRQKNNMIYGSFGIAMILGLLGYLVYNQQRLKNRQQAKEFELNNALVKIETQNKLQEQRLRISRDLHDNIGSQLTFITSSLDNLKYGMKNVDSAVESKITEIGSFTKSTINELRDTIWAMNKEYIDLDDLEGRMGNLMEQARLASPDIQFSLSIDPSIDRGHTFTSVEGVNLYRIIQEAVNNAIKYAEASQIYLEMSQVKGGVQMEIRDNGNGFNPARQSMGNGLRNMKKRAIDVGATLNISSKAGQGSSVLLVLSTP